MSRDRKLLHRMMQEEQEQEQEAKRRQRWRVAAVAPRIGGAPLSPTSARSRAHSTCFNASSSSRPSTRTKKPSLTLPPAPIKLATSWLVIHLPFYHYLYIPPATATLSFFPWSLYSSLFGLSIPSLLPSVVILCPRILRQSGFVVSILSTCLPFPDAKC